MGKQKKYSYIDLAKTVGRRDYFVKEKDHLELLKQVESHPLTKGILSVGPYFVIVGDVVSWKTAFLSSDCEKVTGYEHKEAFEMGAEFLVRIAHPEDFPVIMGYNKICIEKLFSMPHDKRLFQTAIHYYRGLTKDGITKNFQHQSFPIGFDQMGNPYVYTNIITDISHLNRPQIPRSFLLDRQEGVLTEIKNKELASGGSVVKIAPREKEVLKLLASGYSSKAIADEMNISFHTATTYRKRLLEKTGVKNTSELVNFALVHSLF